MHNIGLILPAMIIYPPFIIPATALPRNKPAQLFSGQ